MNREMLAARDRDMVEIWKSGDYNVSDLGEVFGVTPETVCKRLRHSGYSALDKRYRNLRICQLYDEGLSREELCERFGLSDISIYNIVKQSKTWKAIGGKHIAVCKICGKEFSAFRSSNVYCSTKCHDKRKRKSWQAKQCAVCGSVFHGRASRKICSNECKYLYNKITKLKLYIDIRKAYHSGEAIEEIASRLDYNRGTVENICKGWSPKNRGWPGIRWQAILSVEAIARYSNRRWNSAYAKTKLAVAREFLRTHGLEQFIQIGEANGRNSQVSYGRAVKCCWCGEVFYNNSILAKYCSRSCRNKAFRDRHKEEGK